MSALLMILALAAFVYTLVGLFLSARKGLLQASLVAGFCLLAAGYFWGTSFKIVLLSLGIGLAVASGFFVRTRM